MAATIVDLRAELIKILDGDEYNVGVSIPVILRVVDKQNRCPCNTADTGDRLDSDCTYCDNEGFLWTEYVAKAYMAQTSNTLSSYGTTKLDDIYKPNLVDQNDTAVVFLRYSNTPPKIGDSMYQIRLNSDGSVYYRIDSEGNRYFERLVRWIIKESTRVYGDNGELIYYRAVVKKDQTWFENFAGNKKY